MVKNAKILRSYSPNVDLLLNISNIGILITAIDKTTPVFRFFAPRVGIIPFSKIKDINMVK